MSAAAAPTTSSLDVMLALVTEIKAKLVALRDAADHSDELNRRGIDVIASQVEVVIAAVNYGLSISVECIHDARGKPGAAHAMFLVPQEKGGAP